MTLNGCDNERRKCVYELGRIQEIGETEIMGECNTKNECFIINV